MPRAVRVAYFADSFHEVNGMARTSRELDAYARRGELPFLCIRAGETTRTTVNSVELRRATTSIPVDKDLAFDPLLGRHLLRVRNAIRRFKPDLIHSTGPGDIGLMGVYFAYHFDLPLVASWHHNLHELAARRLQFILDHPLFSFLPKAYADFVTLLTERGALEGVALFYKLAQATFAPNPALVDMLADLTGKRVHLMPRGVDTDMFHPSKRFRQDGAFTLGFAGRLQPEKNVRLLVDLQKHLPAGNHKFVIVGDGFERNYLAKRLKRADFTGFLDGDDLAKAYANMDLFVYPSCTDTYGTAVQEAMACGVPPVVRDQGGPHYLVDSGVNGYVARSDAHLIRRVVDVIADPTRLPALRANAREAACRASWERVCDDVWNVYDTIPGLPSPRLSALLH
ncbi:MAG: glycosyltransferase family 1 protein [Acidobacteria bacterium]|nr:glycosyltransferase family 1 protein [Acidobacteriota bacterium]